MPINKQGGKGCKKGKNGKDDQDEVLMVDCKADDGQMFGRVIKVEGDRRFRIFCNDSKERICKLAGHIRRGDRVEKGGLVLISVRDLSFTTTKLVDEDEKVGDIIANVDPRLTGKVKKLDGINPLLFINLENEDSSTIKKRVDKLENDEDAVADDVDEDFFEREVQEETDVDEEISKEERQKELAEKKKKEEKLRTAKRDIKYVNGEIDIDAI
jgi:translation initiation factor IF-1